MQNTELILEISNEQINGPHSAMIFIAKITKNKETNHFKNIYTRCSDDTTWGTIIIDEVEFDFITLDEAIANLVAKNKLMQNEIIYIKDYLIFSYTKFLIKQLNENETKSLKNVILKNIIEKLQINLKCINNPSQNGLKIIKIKGKKLIDGMAEKFIVGKLESLSNLIVIKNINNEIDFMISNDEVSEIKTEPIIPNNYWYFEKK